MDLLVTPEYSCPISSIKRIITDTKKWPAKHKLWVLGSESMKIEELNIVLQLRDEIVIIEYDSSINHKSTDNLDPIFYLFRSERNGQELLVVLLQFKTQHMGVWTSSLERDNILQGNFIYVLRNDKYSVNLFTLICSEALEFQNSMSQEKINYLSFDEKPTIVLNPQMNPKPRNFGFIEFRNYLMKYDKKELFTLNWHCETTINNKPFESHIARSGIIFKGDQVDLSEETVNSNFSLDFHIFHNKKNRYYFFFGNKDQLVLIKNQPLLPQSGANPALFRKNGPIVQTKFVFDIEDGIFKKDLSSNNNYIDVLKRLVCTNYFVNSLDSSILDKERLCVFSSLFFKKPKPDYLKVKNLDSLQMDENLEVVQRITLIEERCFENKNIISKFVNSLNELEHILNQNDLLPDTLINLKDIESHIGFDKTTDKTNYLRNVIGSDGKSQNATVAYLYESVTEVEAKIKFNELLKLFDKESPSIRTVVLYYKLGQDYRYEKYNRPPSILEPIEDSHVLIDKR